MIYTPTMYIVYCGGMVYIFIIYACVLYMYSSESEERIIIFILFYFILFFSFSFLFFISTQCLKIETVSPRRFICTQIVVVGLYTLFLSVVVARRNITNKIQMEKKNRFLYIAYVYKIHRSRDPELTTTATKIL